MTRSTSFIPDSAYPKKPLSSRPNENLLPERLSVVPRRASHLALARHFARLRSAYPTDRVSVVLEIDGPIVDQRHMVRRRLLDHDRVHGTDHFRGVEVGGLSNYAADYHVCNRAGAWRSTTVRSIVPRMRR